MKVMHRSLSGLLMISQSTFYTSEDFSSLNREHEINSELEKNNTWFQLNKLTLNVEKNKTYAFP